VPFNPLKQAPANLQPSNPQLSFLNLQNNMKKIVLFLALAPWTLFAQNTSGIITYQETVKMQINVEGMTEEVRKMIPSEQKFSKMLIFNENAALYKDVEQNEESNDVQGTAAGGAEIHFKMARPMSRYYFDMENGKTIDNFEFFGRTFLIEEEMGLKKWKLTGDQKELLGYKCQKAVLQDTLRKVEAWFTPQIPVAVGPGEFADLPGMVLEVSVGGQRARSVVATKVELKTPEKDALEKPTKGKSVTREEFNKIRDEKMKEMNAQGGNGVIRVIRN
jgi:GLPGLI family protein